MSNHDIGHAMSPVLRRIMELKENGEMSDYVTQTIIKDMVFILNYEDGNAYEAFYEVNRLYCGYCGKHMPDNDHLYSVNTFLFKNHIDDYQHRISNKYTIYGEYLCKDCFRKYVRIFKENINPDKEIIRQEERNEYTVVGDIEIRW